MKASVLAVLAGLAASGAMAADHAALRLRLDPADPLAQGFQAAVTQGFYKAEGLDVTITAPVPGETAEDALARGDADIALEWMGPALAARQAGLPIAQIAQIGAAEPLQMMCRRDLGVNSAADLDRKTIATLLGGRELGLRAYLDANGTAARLIPVFDPAFQLADTRANCVTFAGPPPTERLAEFGITPDQLVTFTIDEPVPQDGLYAMAPGLADRARHDALTRFLRASRKGFGAGSTSWVPDPATVEATAQLISGADGTLSNGFIAPGPAQLAESGGLRR
ncbi:MAG: hypothetical protein DI498_07195 [Paracoccus denitrificans]|nr:MAG: hypothetical protein DI498_07195 [Paracoccus denitrificans]PZO84589.1 MAG: hypothetical protein DI633_07195 [Paracoccus denitrificans]